MSFRVKPQAHTTAHFSQAAPAIFMTRRLGVDTASNLSVAAASLSVCRVACGRTCYHGYLTRLGLGPSLSDGYSC